MTGRTRTEQAQHTPGPWHYEARIPHGSADAEYVVLGVNPDAGKKGVCYAGEHFTVIRTEDEADARLIAAAPEMLVALKEIFDTASPHVTDSRDMLRAVRNVAREAIAKAEGR